MAEAVIGKTRLAGLAIGDLPFQEGFQLRQGTLELVGNAHQGAGFLNARDRSVQNVDLGHFSRNTAAPLCSAVRPAG